MRAPLVSLVTIAWLSAQWSIAAAQQVNLLDVGTRSQLLLDQSIVYQSERVAFTPHPAQKHPANPLLKAEKPWEGGYVSIFAGTVLYNEAEPRYRMWYTCQGNEDYFDARGICYATSDDGLNWERPTVGTRRAKNGRPHNWILPGDVPSVFCDPDDPDPARRYKMICFDPDRGYMAMLSPDGLRWAEQGPKPIVPISYVDDVISAFYDRAAGQFVALPKMSTPVFGRLRRSIYLTASHDFRHWTRPEPAFFADRRDDLSSLARVERARPLLNFPDNMHVMRTEFYGAGAYVAESCTVGFPWVLTVSANVPNPQRGNQEGPIEVQLAVSRDRESWSRPFRTPIIPLGQPGQWDAGMILTASQAVNVGDEVWLYYAGANHTHGAPAFLEQAMAENGTKYTCSIGLATWPKDRFASADGPAEGGTLTTVPLRFDGDRLELNAATKPAGEIRVEFLDAAGRPLEGFVPSEPIVGDSLRHAVVFPGQEDLTALAGRPVCLRFHLRAAELYAFAFRGRP